MIETPLPEDIAAEQAVLAACVIGGAHTFARVAPLVTERSFSREEHADVFRAIKSVAERGDAIDYRTVASEIRKSGRQTTATELVGWISTVPSEAAAETYAKTVAFIATQREIIATANRIARVGYTGRGEDASELLAAAYKEFDPLLRPTGRVVLITPKAAAEWYYEVVDHRKAQDPEYIGWPTGFVDLDKVCALRTGELWYVAAPPGSGKTTFLQNVQENLARINVPSLFVSVEQPLVQLMDRAIAADTRIDSWRIAKGNLDLQDFVAIGQALDRRLSRPAYITDTVTTTADLASVLRLAISRHGVKVAFVDYIQLMSDEVGDNENARVGYISRRLTSLARELGICIVAASQVSRGYAKRADRVVELSDLRDSGRLEMDAFVVLSLQRDEENETTTRLRVLKNRNGASGITVNLYFDPRFTSFASLARADHL